MESRVESRVESQGQGYGNKGGKGKGTYALQGEDSWSGWGSQGGGKSIGPWTLNMLSSSTSQVISRNVVSPPPGLTTQFEVLSCQDVDDLKELGKKEENFPTFEAGEVASKKRMPPMKNYSKGSIRRGDEEKGRKGTGKTKECNLLDKAPSTKELNPFVGATPDREGWMKIKGVMDSGASESVAPPTTCPHYEIKPSPG